MKYIKCIYMYPSLYAWDQLSYHKERTLTSALYLITGGGGIQGAGASPGNNKAEPALTPTLWFKGFHLGSKGLRFGG